MHVFGKIDKSTATIQSNVVNFTQNLTTASRGIQSIKIVSASAAASDSNLNYWNSLNVLFYTSGSSKYGKELKFSNQSSNLTIDQRIGKQFLNKYHNYDKITVIPIPSKYYGEKIKQGSFKFVDISTSNEDNNNNSPIIVDDGFGNLYSTNAHFSQSNAAASSSDSYVGNIFYDKGLVVLTETGSWSGSVDYSDLATNYTLKFDSVNTINTYEYDVNLLPQDYNYTTNYSIRGTLTTDSKALNLSTPFLRTEFTSSNWQPCITTINLYQDGDYDTPVIQATLPKPIRKSDKINTRFKIKLDL